MQPTAQEVDLYVGRRIRQRREALGLSQGTLGRHLGLTFSQVQKYEKGTNRIGAGRLLLIARALGVPIQYFFQDLDIRPAASERTREDLTRLHDAFLSIEDPAKRDSVLALVKSIALTQEQVARARHAAG